MWMGLACVVLKQPPSKSDPRITFGTHCFSVFLRHLAPWMGSLPQLTGFLSPISCLHLEITGLYSIFILLLGILSECWYPDPQGPPLYGFILLAKHYLSLKHFVLFFCPVFRNLFYVLE